MFVLGLLWLDYDVHVLDLSLPGVDLVFFLLVLFNFSLVGNDELPSVDGDVSILDSFVILFGGEVHESLDVLGVVDESDGDNSLLDHFLLDSIHICMMLTIMSFERVKKR